MPYATFGTQELGDNAAAIDRSSGVSFRNHGMICRGANFKVAIDHAERLEIICKHYVLSRTLGEPDYLTDEQWDEFFGRAKRLHIVPLYRDGYSMKCRFIFLFC